MDLACFENLHYKIDFDQICRSHSVFCISRAGHLLKTSPAEYCKHIRIEYALKGPSFGIPLPL